jgi:hypothetical protein
MSQRFAEMHVPAHTEKCLVERTCDICACEADRPGQGDWVAQNGYAISRTTVTFEEGTNFPGDYDTKTLAFDICPTCFMQHLVPFMATHGAKPRTNRED